MDAAKRSSNDRSANSLLAKIEQAEWEQLREIAEPVALQARQLLYARDQVLEHVYFLESGCISLLIDFADGFQAEAALIGSEGMVGIPLTFGLKTDNASAAVLVPSQALRIPATSFVRKMASLPGLQRVIMRYAGALRWQAMQLAACNGHHGLEARFARCVLRLQDRVRGAQLPITHEALASLLCAHRPSISVTAKRLQEAGLIQYAAGQLRVIDRAGLEGVACECYDLMRQNLSAAMDVR